MSRYDVLFMNGKSLMFWALEWFSMSNDAFLLVMDSILTLTIIQDFMSKRGHDIFRRRASHENHEIPSP